MPPRDEFDVEKSFHAFLNTDDGQAVMQSLIKFAYMADASEGVRSGRADVVLYILRKAQNAADNSDDGSVTAGKNRRKNTKVLMEPEDA